MGRSVSYPSDATVVTFRHMEDVECYECEGREEDQPKCATCGGSGMVEPDESDFDCLVEDFRQHLQHLFPSVDEADDWIDREDHVLAENRLARFGMSEYCGLVAYWIVPRSRERSGYFSDDQIEPLANRWIASIADKFVAAFGELSKVGSMSNGESFYRRIDR